MIKRINTARASKGLSNTTKYVLLFAALLLATNIILGAGILGKSVSTVRNMVRKNMLNMSNTAASLIDGDIVRDFTEEDVGTEEYDYVLSELSAFQNNTDIEYIYMVRKDGDGRFVFIVDADPEDPADFGEEVLVTDALKSAARGTAKVDDEPAQDDWGNFYSSYSPVFDSYGRIVAIVGVDFDADWYDKQITDNSLAIGVISLISFLVTLAVLLIVTGNIRRKFKMLNDDLLVLASDVEELANDLGGDQGYTKQRGEKAKEKPDTDGDGDLSAAEIEALSARIRDMHTDIKAYIDYVHEKALTDALTDIGNTTAYMEKVNELNDAISEGQASFRLAVFDINYLKHLNDEFGHLCGDRVIKGAAEVLAAVFGRNSIFRIGGDEFIAVIEGITDDEMADKVNQLDKEIELFNEKHKDLDGSLSLSMGQAVYTPGKDETYRSVFGRADQEMYTHKNEFHKGHRDYDE
jgi:diguanylate cyclase (GGDEF)-like protein